MIDSNVRSLPAPIRDLVETSADIFFATAASLWEMAIKTRQGKLKLPCKAESLPVWCANTGVVLLPISPTHATTPVDPWPQTNDPFDRILLSVCQVENLRLVTLDRALIDHPLAWRA